MHRKRQEATTDSVSEEREPTEAVWDPSPVLWDSSIDFPTFFLIRWTIIHIDTIGCGRLLLRHERFGFDNLNSGKSWDRLYDCPVYEYLSPQPVSLVNCDLLQVLERWSTLFSGEPRLQWYVFEHCLYYLYQIRLKAHQNRCPRSMQRSQNSKPSTEAAMSIAISRKVQKQLGIYIFLGKKILISEYFWSVSKFIFGEKGPHKSPPYESQWLYWALLTNLARKSAKNRYNLWRWCTGQFGDSSAFDSWFLHVPPEYFQ